MDLLSPCSSYIRNVAGGHRGEHGAHWVPTGSEEDHSAGLSNIPDTHLWVGPVFVGNTVVVNHVQAIPGELVIQKLVCQVELDSQEKKVEKLT